MENRQGKSTYFYSSWNYRNQVIDGTFSYPSYHLCVLPPGNKQAKQSNKTHYSNNANLNSKAIFTAENILPLQLNSSCHVVYLHLAGPPYLDHSHQLRFVAVLSSHCIPFLLLLSADQ